MLENLHHTIPRIQDMITRKSLDTVHHHTPLLNKVDHTQDQIPLAITRIQDMAVIVDMVEVMVVVDMAHNMEVDTTSGKTTNIVNQITLPIQIHTDTN